MAQRKGTSRGRRRQAAKAPVIDLEANEVAEETASTPTDDADRKPGEADTPTAEAEAATEDKSASESENETAPGAKTTPEDETPAETPETAGDPAPQTPENRGRGKLIAAGVAALLLAGAAGGAWLYRDLGADYFPPAASKVQAEQMAALQKKIDALTASNSAASTALKQLTSDLEALKTSVQTATETISAQGSSVEAATAKATEALALAQQAGAQAASASEAAAGVKATSEQVAEAAQSALKASQKAETELKTAQSGIDELKSAIAAAAATASSVTGDASESAKAAQAQISGLTLKLAELESKLANAAPAQPDPEISEKITGLDSAVAALRSELSKMAEEAKSNVARAAKSTEAQANRDQMVQALNQLTSNAASGKPFAAALAALKPVFSDEPAFQALSKAAATGVPDQKSLLAEFATVHAMLTKGSSPSEPAETAKSESSSFLSSLQDRLSSVIKIRPSGSQDWSKLADAMAEQAKTGQLGEMVQSASEVDQTPPKALADWLERAKARVALDQNVSALSVRAMEQLAQTSKTGG